MVVEAAAPDDGESAAVPDNFFSCEICAESKNVGDMFAIQGCSHAICSACIAMHVTVKVQEGATAAVTCPGWPVCLATLDPTACRAVLSPAVLERWEVAICEALIAESEKFYCPYKDCSALLVYDCESGSVIQSECPVCWRLFCAECRVPWHSGVECMEFQRLNEYERGKEDLMLRELAKTNDWKRCPRCKFYVEKIAGCVHVTCRCGHEFCYGCGTDWSTTHGSYCFRRT